MATSGTVTFTVTRDQLITAALIECGVLDPENSAATPTTAQINTASSVLNMMLKAWEARGLQLWEKRYAAVFLNYNQNTYILGSPGPAGDHATLTTPLNSNFVVTNGNGSGTTITLTTISTTATPGTPAVTIASGWNIGIQQTNGSFFWTTVNGTPVGNVVTLTSSSPSTVSNAIVYAYQTKLVRPLRITDGFLRQVANSTDVPVLIIPREQYNRFGQKTSQGTSIQIMYDPQVNNGQLYVYPTPSTIPGILFIEIQKPIDDMSSASDNFDLPQEWFEAIKYALAFRLCASYGVPSEKVKLIKVLADESYEMVDGWDQEAASVYLMPNNWDYHNKGYGTNK